MINSFSIFVIDPDDKVGNFDDLEINPNDKFWLSCEILIEFKNPDEYDCEIYTCIIANNLGFYDFLKFYSFNNIRFIDKAIIVDKFDKKVIYSFIEQYLSSLKNSTRETFRIKMMSRFDHEFDEADEIISLYSKWN